MPKNLNAVVILAILSLPVSVFANSIGFVGAVNGDGEGGTGTNTIFGDGATGNGKDCTTFGNGPSTPGFFGSILGSPDGGIGPCGYLGGTLTSTNGSPASFSMTAITGIGSGTASGTAQAALTSSSAVVNGQNVAGDFLLTANASQTYSGGNGLQVQEATAAAIVDDPNWVVTAPGFITGQTLIPVYTWAISTSINVSNPEGFFTIQLGMETNQNGEFAGLSYAGYGGEQPYCGHCATGFTLGTGSLSGTATFSYTPNGSSLPVGEAVDETVGLLAVAQYNASIDPQATLIGVSMYTPDGTPVTDFNLTTSTGVFTSSGFTPFTSASPEPGTCVLVGLGFVGFALIRVRSR